MTIQTKIPMTIEVPVPEEMCVAFNLIPPGAADVGAGIDHADIQRENGLRVQAILRAVLNLSAGEFPLMTREEWYKLMKATYYFEDRERGMMMVAALSADDPHFFSRVVLNNYQFCGFSESEVVRFKALRPSEVFTIYLVSERFWDGEGGPCSDFRALLSEVSHRPREAVFSDDPSVD